MEQKPVTTLDLRHVICPTNFVKTKLKLEEMQPGEILEILIDEGEPISNVPRSVKEEGHKVVRVERIDNYFRLWIEKALGE